MNRASPQLIACYLRAQAGLPLPILPIALTPPPACAQQPRA